MECLDAMSVEDMFNKIDTDGSGFIEYSEFLTAAMDRSMQLSQESLERAFKELAGDDDYITREKIENFFSTQKQQEEREEGNG